jgi:arginyl-tRNA synthetase
MNTDIQTAIARLIQKKFPEIETQEINIAFPNDLEFGDYTSNIAFKIASIKKQSPAELARQISSDLILSSQDIFDKISDQNGYINFKLSKRYLIKELDKVIVSKSDYGRSKLGLKRKIVLEYFQNNVAKPPHIGHLRSAVLGDSLYRILNFLDFNVVSDTHIGDWGTQFGILIYGFKNYGDFEIVKKDPINELNKLYILTTKKIEENPEIRELGKQEFKKLEEGDSQNKEIWQWFVNVSVEDFQRYRQLLKINEFDYNLGESFYEDKMAQVLELFESKKLVTVGETGEKYIDLEKYKLGRCILYKSDGASTYHMRDFATYIYRRKEFNFYRNYYIVDNRQEHHFRQLFKVLSLAGFPTDSDSQLISFGFMSLPEGPISTRKGTVISLEELVSQAKQRSLEIINEKNPDLINKEKVAEMIGLAAIKYFDLSHNPKTEFVFTWDKALSFEGNTGPYLQYTHARICGIINKSNRQINSTFLSDNLDYNLLESEQLVLRKLHQFPTVVASVSESLLPNVICNYLFDLAQTFNSFYQSVQVLSQEDSRIMDFRLNLCIGTAQVIKNGLYLLGIEAPSRM